MLPPKLTIPFTIILDGANAILLEIVPFYEYKNGKKTDTLLGYKYLIVEDKNFEKYAVKIASETPLISKEQVETAKGRIHVTFENAIAKPYRTNTGDYELSISATGISIVK